MQVRCSIKKSDGGRPPTPPSCTTSPAGARATSRSTTTGTSASTRPRSPSAAIDLKQLVDRLQLRGIDLPILIRFTDILKHRLGEIHDAFPDRDRRAQLQRQLLLRLSDQGEPAAAGRRGGAATSASRISFGLEAGSKPELLAVLAHGLATTRRSSATASRTPSSSRWRCWPRRSGRNIIPVVEKYTELELILEIRREDRRAAARSACASSWPPAAPAAGSRRAATARSSA